MKKIALTLSLAVMAILLLSSCARTPVQPLNNSTNYYQYIQPSFAEYTRVTSDWLTSHRAYISDETATELAMNAPYAVEPTQTTDKAILLVHGLGDSPYSFSDLATTLSQQGFYVEVLLLPGHGSNPKHLELIEYKDWQHIVDHYANLLKQKYKNVWLGGFSTGGNLVTIHAMEQQGIAGLMLFSPGFQSRTPFLEKLAPLAALFIDGYRGVETNFARYSSAPLNGAIAYTDSADRVRELFEQHSLSIPTLIAVSEADSIIDAGAIKGFYRTNFSHPNNRFIWYGDTTEPVPNISVKTMRLPQQKITTGSHMSMLFAPDNSYYGRNGRKKMCNNGFDKEAAKRCKEGAETWYSAWGVEEEGKIHARLTFNPYYQDLARQMQHVAN
ncbi:lysophospholipase [Psychrobium sp. MM17-31]|uniref:alpha/beta hydrolase n=1 Tax=Psychrobium sp. MM17-31 TaxID=2917758 RepID=UPI001EF42E6E|nr:alpha/beta fold hydrolase [Psychrobium sp. MM17-31]MCG7530398.1 lysophospholipase [Psychrobium sp. MM17-31]